jgi:hypothetical protein
VERVHVGADKRIENVCESTMLNNKNGESEQRRRIKHASECAEKTGKTMTNKKEKAGKKGTRDET